MDQIAHLGVRESNFVVKIWHKCLINLILRGLTKLDLTLYALLDGC